jgi:hypothetical protein
MDWDGWGRNKNEFRGEEYMSRWAGGAKRPHSAGKAELQGSGRQGIGMGEKRWDDWGRGRNKNEFRGEDYVYRRAGARSAPSPPARPSFKPAEGRRRS